RANATTHQRPRRSAPQPNHQPPNRPRHPPHPWCFYYETRLFGLPVVSAMLANRAARGPSSRAAKTATHQPERNGPDFTARGRCDSFGRRNDGKSKRQPQQRSNPTNKPTNATKEPEPPPHSRTRRPFPERGPLRRRRVLVVVATSQLSGVCCGVC